jgi:hypothetical protein
MKTILSCLALAGTLAAASLAAQPPAFDPSRSNAKSMAIADEVMKAMGGGEAWQQTRFLRFDFGVEAEGKARPPRSHWWDRQTGRYRLEGRTPEGDPYVVLMNLHTKQGSAWLKGAKLEGEEAKKYLERAFGAWTNDTYWLLVPYKLKDGGVQLGYDGELKKGADAWDKLVLTFDNVGLTPKDKYWLFVNRRTHLIDRWDFVLKGEKTPPTTFEWKGWKRYGGIMLSPERVDPAKGTKILFPVLDAPKSMPDAVFTSNAPVPAG